MVKRSLLSFALTLTATAMLTFGCASPGPSPVATNSVTPTASPTPVVYELSPLMQKTVAQEAGKRAFEALPAAVTPAIAGLGPKQVRVLRRGTQGQSKVGPFTVDHRAAFVQGSVAGKSVWGPIKDKIKEAVVKKKLAQEEADELIQLMDLAANLSADERKTMLELLDQVPETAK